jgi:hypothetical protein
VVYPYGASAKALALGDPFQAHYGPDFERPYNAAAHLNLPTPASPEAIHPDVVDFGAAWNSYRYWMAMTPYDGTDASEVPCILATNDITAGGTWVVPAGYTNPIATDPVGAQHYADTDLLYDEASDRLYVFYIDTDESTFQRIVSRYTTGDGTWSSQATVITGASQSNLLNPSIIKRGANWRIYYTNDGAGTISVRYRESSTAPDSGYGSEVTCTHPINLGIELRNFQNINVAKAPDGAVISLVADGRASSGLAGRLRIGRSTDGDTFAWTGGPVMEAGPGGAWDEGGIYRASLLVDTDGVIVVDDDEVLLWYSAYKPNNTDHGTGFTRLPATVLGG